MKARYELKKRGWRWYIDDKKGKCVADSGNNYWTSKKNAKRGFNRFVKRMVSLWFLELEF